VFLKTVTRELALEERGDDVLTVAKRMHSQFFALTDSIA
jgi:hypothetical protein